MASSTNNTLMRAPNSPKLFLDNGYKTDRLLTTQEGSLEQDKTSLEDSLTKNLQTSLDNGKRLDKININELSLSNCGSYIYIKTSDDSGANERQFEIQTLLNPTSIGRDDPIYKHLQKILSNNTDLKTQLEKWSTEAKNEQLDETTKAVQDVWNKALKHIKDSLPKAESPPKEEETTAIEESSLKINFTKKYITYKNSNGELTVIDLVKNKALAQKLNIDVAINAIEKKHNIRILCQSKFCDKAKDLVKKGKIFDTHFLDKASQGGKNSPFEKIKKKLNDKIKDLKAKTPVDSEALKNLEKFKKSLEKKSSKNPNGVDWFAVNLAINQRKAESKAIINAVKNETTKHEVSKEIASNITEYATDISLLRLKKEDVILLVEKQRAQGQHKLLPADSKESLLVRAILHGVDEIAEKDDSEVSYEQFESLFGATMTPEIIEILENTQKDPTPQAQGDVVYGMLTPESRPSTPRSIDREDNAEEGLQATAPRSRSNSIESLDTLSDTAEEIPVERSLGGRGSTNTVKEMPQDKKELVKEIKEKYEARPHALIRTEENKQTLRAKIYAFLDKADSNEELDPLKQTALEALWKAETNKQRGQIIDIVEFMQKNSIENTTTPWEEALKNPNETTLALALKSKSTQETEALKKKTLLEEVAQRKQLLELLRQAP